MLQLPVQVHILLPQSSYLLFFRLQHTLHTPTSFSELSLVFPLFRLKIFSQLIYLLQQPLFSRQSIVMGCLLISPQLVALLLNLIDFSLKSVELLLKSYISCLLLVKKRSGYLKIACYLISLSFKHELLVFQFLFLEFHFLCFPQKLSSLSLQKFMLLNNWLILSLKLSFDSLVTGSLSLSLKHQNLILKFIIFKSQSFFKMSELVNFLTVLIS